jgi:hypothetical protein
MIVKIVATRADVVAMEEATYRGLSINSHAGQRLCLMVYWRQL